MPKQRVARSKEECCTGDSIVVCLHQDANGLTKGWYIGPLFIMENKICLHYIPKRESLLGTIALMRAARLAEQLESELVIYDPDDLLSSSWVS